MRGPAAALAFALCLAVAAEATAAVRLSTEVKPRKVEVGGRFMVQVRAMADAGEQPRDPKLELPASLTPSGPSVGSQTQMSIVNGQVTQSVGLTATWVVTPSRVGTFRIGPASVQSESGRTVDRVVTVEVVPQGSLPQATPPLGGQPLDPWSMLRGRSPFPGFPGFPDLDEPEPEPQLPLLPEEYRIERALDPSAFLRARAVPRKVVVGEQVTLSVYAYAGRGAFEPGAGGEPSRDDFLAFNLMDAGNQLQGYQFDLSGQRWIAVKIAEFALFPLKAGKLAAGEMTFAFRGRAYSKDPLGLERKSPALEVSVVEPPLDGRPPGYRIGDVGRYTLSARVEPREVPAGGSVSVVAKLEGTGNVPYSLLIPEQSGVRFLEPQLIDQVAPRDGQVRGFRTLTYIVELGQPGEIDLGELTLPFYDPKARAYGVARAALGVVKVTGSAKPDPGAARVTAAEQRLRGLVTPPATLSAWKAPSSAYLTGYPVFWASLAGLPLLALLGFAAADLGSHVRRRLRDKRGSLGSSLDDALAELAAAAGRGDAGATASAAERALFLSIELGARVKGRAILKTQLPSTLAAAGVEPALGDRVGALLDQCDELRFAGESADLQAFAAEALALCKKLGAFKLGKREGKS